MSSKIFCKSWGAEYIAADVVRFRLWATGQQKVMLRLAGKDQEMQVSGDGWFTLDVSGVTPGTEYNFVLSDGMVVPDPASRAQKTDVNGPSYVVDPGSYTWRNTGWKGSRWEQAVVYEMHTGTFTPEGTFRAAIAKLPYLAELGVTVIEVMPVAQFGGERGWGYDGVLLYAPHSAYGTPDDFKAFIDAAHGYGLSVVLDIVLNHFGPEGNYLPLLAPAFFHKERMTPWGNGIAYDVDAVRRYIIEAPLYWLTEYHLDGLRFDAIDQIEDSSAKHVLVEIAQRIREDITDRPIHLTTEDSRNIISLHPRDQDGNAPLFTAEWNDDFHNAIHVFATGETQAYYNDFADAPEKHLARALAEGFAYQGEISPQTGEPRGVKSTGQPPVAFVDFIQNHDQVGNRAQGDRLITLAGAERTKVLLATLLLSPHIPLLFMGEEYGESRPFLFFTDFHGDLARAVREGRAKEFADHAGENVPDPNAPETFQRSKLNWKQQHSEEGKAWLAFTRELLLLRQKHIVPLLSAARESSGTVLQTAPGFIAVSWRFPGGTLSLALNISATTVLLPDLPGKTLFAWPNESTGSLSQHYRSLQPFIRAGLVNSLTQTVIKLTAPGVPDIYQGSEALNFSLVDPDNRREPDFATLAQQLDQLTPGVFSREESWLNGQVNQYVTAALLRLRQQNHELFRFGDYIPLRAVGQRADKVIAYARVNHDDALIVVAPRLVFAECDGLLSQSHSGFWSGTDIIIPGQLNQHRYRNVLTQERLMPGERLSLASHQGGVLVLMSD